MVQGAHEGEGAPVSPEVQLFEPKDESVDEPTANVPTEETPPDPVLDQFEIGGKNYSRAEVEGYVNNGRGIKSTLTRKTQEFGEERRDYEDTISQLRSELGSRPSPTADSTDEDEDFASRLDRRLSNIEGHQIKQDERFKSAEKESQVETQLDESILSMKGRPHFNYDEVRTCMDANGLGPHQAELAYHLLYSGRMGEAVGERNALRRGAGARAPMGAGESHISPNISTPHDAPGVHQNIGEMSWDDCQKAAQSDPAIPKHRTY